MKNVIAFIEHANGQARRVSLEAASEARVVADKLGGTAHAVIVERPGAVAELSAAMSWDPAPWCPFVF